MFILNIFRKISKTIQCIYKKNCEEVIFSLSTRLACAKREMLLGILKDNCNAVNVTSFEQSTQRSTILQGVVYYKLQVEELRKIVLYWCIHR